MAAWDELKPILARLRDQQPGVLVGFPAPEVDEARRPPFRIRLAAWATDTAAELHRRFGRDVELTVGALPYPPARWRDRAAAPGQLPELPEPPIPREIAVTLAGPAVVSSGHTLRHGLLLRNHTDAELAIATTGQVIAAVVDPRTGEVVGGFSGMEAAPLVIFQVPPGAERRVPLLIGTASFAPRLGYAVPPGQWGVQAALTLGPDPRESPRGRTPLLPLTITA